MATIERRVAAQDRRRAPRGGRRPYDKPGKHPPIVVADTDEAVRRALVRYLDMYGFRVTQAARIEEGIPENGVEQPEVIVTELTTAATSRLTSLPRIPTIVTVTDDLHRAPDYAEVMLVKPFSLPALLDELRRIIRAHAAPARVAE